MQQTSPVQQMTASQSPQPAVSSHLVLCATRKLGWFKRIQCYLVFQEEEVVLVHLDAAGTRQAAAEFRAEQKAQGKGVIAITLAMVGFWRSYGDRYYPSSRDELLALYRDNVAIPYPTIQRLVFRTARVHHTANRDGLLHPTPGKLIIEGQHGKWKFTHDYFDRKKNIKRILGKLVGNALSYRAQLFKIEINIGGSPNEID